MTDLKLRRAAIKELLDAHHDRMGAMDALVERSKPDLLHNALLGLASWNAQALSCLLQIELDRLSSIEGIGTA